MGCEVRCPASKTGKFFYRAILPGILLLTGVWWFWGRAYWEEFRSPAPPPQAIVPGEDFSISLPGGETMEMVWIEPGEFLMGSPVEEQGRWSDEGPQTPVRITKGFWMGRYPVTQGQWEALRGNNPSHLYESGADAPVEYVSWVEAMEFCRILTARDRAGERLPEGYVYTLPTEAQWEYACRAGTQTRYNLGDGVWDLLRAGWYQANSGGRTRPVGQKTPNDWGLYDMHGNVREWTASWYGPYPGEEVEDFQGSRLGQLKVNRGGSWSITGQYCRSAYRHWNEPNFRFNNLGFRVSLSPGP